MKDSGELTFAPCYLGWASAPFENLKTVVVKYESISERLAIYTRNNS